MGRFSYPLLVYLQGIAVADPQQKSGASSGTDTRNRLPLFLNPKTGAPYRLHEFYYLHKRILKQAGLPWVAFRNLQRQCMEVEI